ncbi:hypothetical protein D9756_008664 [Leucocoprinus leucothites]|uniref:Nudix hydrolase domain-containing protein n=1 Tax=Leucocoprinus leucothites TaxID=201217 RepID=A0A8H5D0E9_9AGAR|nr:hypothetical protein D9756_008664 [Leucoagaricus leucothites]
MASSGPVPSKTPLSYLDLLNLCDNVHIPLPNQPQPDNLEGFDAEVLIPLYLTPLPSSPIIGLLRPIILEQLKFENARSRELGLQEVWVIQEVSEKEGGRTRLRVSFAEWVKGWEVRTQVMKELCERWRDGPESEYGFCKDVCGPRKWRGEMYPVYKDPFGVHDHPQQQEGKELGEGKEMNYAFEMERSACALFGIVTYGVHMSIYAERMNEEGMRSLSVWVPTRARTKQTFPGYLDNTVAGGIPSGMGMFESMVKECMEEASLPASIVEKYARAAGVISYFYRTSTGWLQPEVEYVYGIAIPSDVDASIFEPKPLDGEVESFEFMNQDKVTEKLRAGLFKPNCGIVLIDLFMRLGYITPDNEPNYMALATRLRGRFRYSLW